MAGTTTRGFPYPTGGDPADVAADIQALASSIDADITALGDWTAYTPTWTAVTANPVIGTGSLTGRYKINGNTASVHIVMIAGATTTFGSGQWIFSLPAGVTAAYESAIAAFADDSSAAQRWAGVGWIHAGGVQVVRTILTAGGSGAASSVPFAWASGDTLIIQGELEIT